MSEIASIVVSDSEHGRPARDLSSVKCYKCGKMGHMAVSCKTKRVKAERVRASGASLGVLDHKHAGLVVGEVHTHQHACESCTKVYSHRHSIKTEAESRAYGKHRCPDCRGSRKVEVVAANTAPVEELETPLTDPPVPSPVDPDDDPTGPPSSSGGSPQASAAPVVTWNSATRDQLLSYLRIRATGVRRDVQLHQAIPRVASTWLKDHGVLDEVLQEQYILAVAPRVFETTLIDRALMRSATSERWRNSHRQANLIASGLLPRDHTWLETAKYASAGVVVAYATKKAFSHGPGLACEIGKVVASELSVRTSWTPSVEISGFVAESATKAIVAVGGAYCLWSLYRSWRDSESGYVDIHKQ